MAITSYPFDNQDTTETQYSQLFRELQDTGVVGSSDSTALKVIGDSTGLNVKLSIGRCIVRGHVMDNDAQLTIPIDAAGTSARVDRIVARLDPLANSVVPAVLKGDAGVATGKTLTQTDTGIYELLLAEVKVPANTPTIAPGDVDATVRPFNGMRTLSFTDKSKPTTARQGQLGRNLTTGLWEEYTGNVWQRLQRGGYHWGSGAAFPATPQLGDTFHLTTLNCQMRFTSAGWRQTEIPTVSTQSARPAYNAVGIYSGFTIYVTDLGERLIFRSKGNGYWAGEGIGMAYEGSYSGASFPAGSIVRRWTGSAITAVSNTAGGLNVGINTVAAGLVSQRITSGDNAGNQTAVAPVSGNHQLSNPGGGTLQVVSLQAGGQPVPNGTAVRVDFDLVLLYS